MDDLHLSDEDAKRIEKQIDSGRYETAGDVISAALHLLEQEDAKLERWLRSEIPARLAEFERDPSSGVTIDRLSEELDEIYHKDIEAAR